MHSASIVIYADTRSCRCKLLSGNPDLQTVACAFILHAGFVFYYGQTMSFLLQCSHKEKLTVARYSVCEECVLLFHGNCTNIWDEISTSTTVSNLLKGFTGSQAELLSHFYHKCSIAGTVYVVKSKHNLSHMLYYYYEPILSHYWADIYISLRYLHCFLSIAYKGQCFKK